MEVPKICIIMINYNYAKYIQQAIESVINQTLLPYEYIIIDDCSTDNSSKIIKSYAKKYSFIKFFQRNKNKGFNYNVTLGLKNTTANYIYFLASDDFIAPSFIEETSKALMQNPNVGLVCSIPVFINASNNFFHRSNKSFKNISGYFFQNTLINLLKKGFFIAGHTSVIKKDYLIKKTIYPTMLKWHSDWYTSHIIALKYGIYYINKPLAFLRVHKNSYSQFNQTWHNQKQIIENLFHLLNIKKNTVIAKQFYKTGIIFIIPYMFLYVLKHPIQVFSYSPKILFHFFIKILKKTNIINFTKHLINLFLVSLYKLKNQS